MQLVNDCPRERSAREQQRELQRQRKSAKRYVLRNKARSFLSTTLLLGKPEAEPETTRPPLRTTSRALSFLCFVPRIAGRAKRSWRSRVWQIAGAGTSASRRALSASSDERTRPVRKRCHGYIGGINRIPIRGTCHLTAPERRSRAIRWTIHLWWLRKPSYDTFRRSASRSRAREEEGPLSFALSISLICSILWDGGRERVDRKANTVLAGSPSICQSSDLNLRSSSLLGLTSLLKLSLERSPLEIDFVIGVLSLIFYSLLSYASSLLSLSENSKIPMHVVQMLLDTEFLMKFSFKENSSIWFYSQSGLENIGANLLEKNCI